MSRTARAFVEVDLSDIDDADIIAEASARGHDFGAAEVADLASAIERGDKADAHRCLLALIADSPLLRHAAENGRFRRTLNATPTQAPAEARAA